MHFREARDKYTMDTIEIDKISENCGIDERDKRLMTNSGRK